jgi:hypothetical protein
LGARIQWASLRRGGCYHFRNSSQQERPFDELRCETERPLGRLAGFVAPKVAEECPREARDTDDIGGGLTLAEVMLSAPLDDGGRIVYLCDVSINI